MQLKRKKLRLENYDYSSPGAYFVTICCYKRRPVLGEINVLGKIILTEFGTQINHWYSKIEEKFLSVKCDQFICMPDHVHMIIQILQSINEPGPTRRSAPTNPLLPHPVGAGLCARPRHRKTIIGRMIVHVL
jgi:hypothetical protein